MDFSHPHDAPKEGAQNHDQHTENRARKAAHHCALVRGRAATYRAAEQTSRRLPRTGAVATRPDQPPGRATATARSDLTPDPGARAPLPALTALAEPPRRPLPVAFSFTF